MKNLDGWTDDGTDDGTDGWKGGPTTTNTAGQTDTTNIIMVEIRDFAPCQLGEMVHSNLVVKRFTYIF
jgi:hypothetical protein